MKKIIGIVLLSLFVGKTYAQNPMLDTLITRLQILSREKPSLPRDTLFIQRLNLLTERTINLSDSRADFFLDSLRRFTEKTKWAKSLGLYQRAIGKKNDKQGNYTEALNHYSKASEIFEKAGGDPYDLAYTYILSGFVLNNNGMTDKCKIYMEKALPLAKKTKNTNNLCWILDFYGDYNYYDNFGVRNYPKALQYYLEVEKNLPNATSANLKADNAHCLANVYLKLGDEKKAEAYRDKALKMAQETNNRVVIFAIYADIADIYQEKKQYEEAIRYRKLSLEYAQKSDWKEMISRAENYLFQTYKAAGYADSALKYFEIFKAQEDSLGRISVNQKYVELETKYNSEKQIANIKDLQNQNLRQIRNFLAILLFLGIAIITYIIWSNRQLKVKNDELLTKNEEIKTALLKGQTMERKRVASELHDTLSTKVSTLKWKLEIIESDKFTSRDKKIFDSVLQSMDEVYTDIRLISHNMLPPELENDGLTVALQHLVDKLNMLDKTKFDLYFNNFHNHLEKRAEYELYSIILELVNNILKHAQATAADITLSQINNQLHLAVKDNGSGIQESDNQGIGLKNIQSRTESLRGNLTIKSENNKGTSIEIIIPTNG